MTNAFGASTHFMHFSHAAIGSFRGVLCISWDGEVPDATAMQRRFEEYARAQCIEDLSIESFSRNGFQAFAVKAKKGDGLGSRYIRMDKTDRDILIADFAIPSLVADKMNSSFSTPIDYLVSMSVRVDTPSRTLVMPYEWPSSQQLAEGFAKELYSSFNGVPLVSAGITPYRDARVRKEDIE